MIKNKDMNDQLHEILNQVELSNEEKEYLLEFIKDINLSHKKLNEFLSEKDNIAKVVLFLESLTGEKNV